jgi:hypothetical protein
LTRTDRSDWLLATATGSSRAVQADAILDMLERRARPGERPEEALLDLGLVDGRDFALELAIRSGLPYSGLRGFIPDPRLFLYVPVATAVAQRVCPLVLVDDSLKLASAYLDPDLLAVRTRFPNLDLGLVIVPRDELLDALRLVAPGL